MGSEHNLNPRQKALIYTDTYYCSITADQGKIKLNVRTSVVTSVAPNYLRFKARNAVGDLCELISMTLCASRPFQDLCQKNQNLIEIVIIGAIMQMWEQEVMYYA